MLSKVSWPHFVTTTELAAITAGGIDYIRTKDNVVKGLALRLDLNPDAPDAVVFGKGKNIEARAALLLESGAIVPTYVKRKTNLWEYLGQYRATSVRADKSTIATYGYTRERNSVAGVLFLESMSEPKIQVSGGGYADAQTRREIEVAAIEFVTRQLVKERFAVHDHQRENRGYDLMAERDGHKLFVEVKGTDASIPRFFLTRNESKRSTELVEWRLYVVCSARRAPALHTYTESEMRSAFSFDPLAWECSPNE